jgi:hypothetical protein
LKAYHPEQIHRWIESLEKGLGKTSFQDGPTMLSWDEVPEMAKENIMFGSHTKTHSLLTQIAATEVLAELSESKKIIEEHIGKPVYFLSYPNGFYNAQIVNLAKELGYLGAFTCDSGSNHTTINPFEFRRKHVREDRSMGLNRQFSELFFKIGLSDVGDLIQRWRKVDAY